MSAHYWMFKVTDQQDLLVRNGTIFWQFLQDMSVKYACIYKNGENDSLLLQELYLLFPNLLTLSEVKAIVMTEKWQCFPVANFPALKPLGEDKKGYQLIINL